MSRRKERRPEAALRGAPLTVAVAPPDTAPLSRRTTVICVLLLAVPAILAYANTFGVPMILDDLWLTNIARTAPNKLLLHFCDFWRVIPGRPLLGLTLALNYQVSGLNVWSYHAVNLLIHVLAGVALFGLVRRTFLTPALRPRFGAVATPLACANAGLWLLHPLQTQAVTYIIQRGESLTGLFYLLALYCAVRAGGTHARWWWIGGAAAACLLGLATKQVIATAPVVILLYYWVFLPDGFKALTGWARRHWAPAAAVVLVWAALCAFSAVMSTTIAAGFGVKDTSPVGYVATQLQVIPHYLRLVFWPHPLCLDYTWPFVRSWGELTPWALLPSALVVLTLVGLWLRTAYGFAGAWFFLILAPTSSFFPLADAAVEHRMYLPIAAIVVLVCAGSYRLLHAVVQSIGAKGRDVLALVLLAALAICLGTVTFRRNDKYRFALAIWRNTLRQRPHNPRALTSVGEVLAGAGRHEAAIPYFREAVRLKPDYAAAVSNLAVSLATLQRFDEAAKYFQARVDLKVEEGQAGAYANLGKALIKLDRQAEGVACLETALKLEPGDAELEAILGRTLRESGRNEQALIHLQSALRLNPDDARSAYELGMVLCGLNRPAEAVPYLEQFVRSKPKNVDARTNLAAALANSGRREQAIEHLRVVLQIDPNFVPARQNLEVLSRNP